MSNYCPHCGARYGDKSSSRSQNNAVDGFQSVERLLAKRILLGFTVIGIIVLMIISGG